MKPDNAFMLELTANMPCKQVDVNNVPYFQRFYAGTFNNGNEELDLWFHRFLSADGDRHLHWHPMNMRSAIICGSYLEEYIANGKVLERSHFAGDITRNYLINLRAAAGAGYPLRKPPRNARMIAMHDIHRIAEIEPNTWTVLIVRPERIPTWGFVDSKLNVLSHERGAGRYWWRDFLPRGLNYGDVCH